MPDLMIMVGGTDLRGGVVTLTATPTALPYTTLEFVGIWLQNPTSNTGAVNIYDSVNDTIIYAIPVGGSLHLDIDNISKVRVAGTASETLRWGGLVK